jgi:hypothetical protein
MKYLAYIIMPALALTLAGASVASAHGWFGGFGQAIPEEIAQRQETMFQNQAGLLGISVDDVKNAWAEGKNFREIAEEQGISQEQLQERMQDARQEQLQNRLQAMVDNGVISQEQANQRLQFMEERMANGETAKGFHRGFGQCFGW